MIEIRSLESDKEKGKTSFILKDTTPAFANALRRAIIEDVPVMAIEDIEFRKNSSILYDELVAHRLGLIPLTTDLKSYNLPEKCKCDGKGCARCQVKLTLKVKGPGTAYSSDIKSQDSSIKPVFPKTPIVKLGKNQSLEFEATAMLGHGKVHMKWSPSHVHYKQKSIIEITDKCDGCGKCISACPVNIFELKDNKAVLIKDNHINCHLCNACQDICPVNAITVKNSNDFIFCMESWGQMEGKKIVVEATKILQEKLTDFADKIKEAKLSE